jgi:hypothetical protein
MPEQFHAMTVMTSLLNLTRGSAQAVRSNRLCRKRAVPLDAMCAKSRLFNTTHKCFRAGLISGNLLKKMVSAEGIEPSTY